MLEFWLLSVSLNIWPTNMQLFCVFADVLYLISVFSIGRSNILCSSKFVVDALDNPAMFCTVQGE